MDIHVYRQIGRDLRELAQSITLKNVGWKSPYIDTSNQPENISFHDLWKRIEMYLIKDQKFTSSNARSHTLELLYENGLPFSVIKSLYAMPMWIEIKFIHVYDGRIYLNR